MIASKKNLLKFHKMQMQINTLTKENKSLKRKIKKVKAGKI